VLDTLTAIARRLRAGLPIHQPDKLHLHHKLQALGLSDRTLFLIALATGILLGATALAAVLLGGWTGWVLLAAAAAVLCVLYVIVRYAAIPRMAASRPARSR
jgi:UDP-GlcNAc:undecaprenyl-phosphate GlcNAc-1-phosphate transferase